MSEDERLLGEILLRGGYLSKEDIDTAEQVISQDKISLRSYLLCQKLLTEDLLGQAVSEALGVSYSDLNSNPPSKEQVQKIPEDIARKYRCVLFKSDQEKKSVVITTDDPKREDLLAVLATVFPDQDITVTGSLAEDIDRSFIHYQKPLETRFSKIIENQKHIAPEILEEIFRDAYTFHASDIHFEPQAKIVVIRFRIDGVLHEAGRIPREYYENVLNRIKIQSRLRIDEHFATQDGAMQSKFDDMSIDLRVSVVPTVEGEKTVLRVLNSGTQGFVLSELGLQGNNLTLFEEAAKKPFGMIMVVGPTGSGKTTTLYTLLKALNQPGVNITTIEDPVEYKMLGTNQIQVNALTDLTFAKGLRSIVRQDPDIILVGEVRDRETAEIAVNAALTGHLLLSTFHANDAATAIPRILDMGVEPFLLSSTLELIAAQRLARRVCQHCKKSAEFGTEEITKIHSALGKYLPEKKYTFYKGNGCEVCGHSGYHGRVALFEIIKITPELQELIIKNPSSQAIWNLAKEQGAQSMFEDGIEKVKAGLTTLSELLRIVEPPKK